MVKVCERCTWEYEGGYYDYSGDFENCCRKCCIIMGGQMTWSNIKAYMLNKEYFSRLVISQIKNRNLYYNEIEAS